MSRLQSRRGVALAALVVLVALAPVFAWGASAVGYAEPLENAAEATGATDEARSVHTGVLPDYGVPGLGSAAGTFVAAAVGTALTLVVTTGIGRVLGSPTEGTAEAMDPGETE